jgi:hypothetical protein
MTMTLEQFQATRRHSDRLAEEINDEALGGAATGFIYLGCLFIEDVNDSWHEKARAQGKFHLLIGRDEWLSNDLAELERLLFEFADSEGYFDDEKGGA